MIFNFWYGQHNKFTLTALTDVVTPIYHGLAEAGHRVIGFGTSILPAPVINILVEYFPVDGVVDYLLEFRKTLGADLVLGLLCPDDIDDAFKLTDRNDARVSRRPNLMRLLPVVDFVWTLVPQVALYDGMIGPGKTAFVRYGFTERSLEPELIRNPALRDVDLVLFGDLCDNGNPRHAALFERLKPYGFASAFGYQADYPKYVTDDLMRRAKISLDVRSRAEVKFLNPSRVARALHSGTAIVAERFDESPLADLYNYADAGNYDTVAERCVEMIRSKSYVAVGLAALQRFRAETSMRDNMAAALRLPVFERLGAA